MIELRNVTKRYRTRSGWKCILENASLVLPRGRNIGVLGRNGAGKSTLMRLIAAAELPDRGEIRRRVRVSWPLGFSGGFQGSLTGRDNVRFVARIYGEAWRPILDFVNDFSELGPY